VNRIAVLLAFAGTLCLVLWEVRADERSNVVFLLVDDSGWTDIGCFGSDLYQTPNIDRLASAGMKFTDGYAACTVCSPTRAAAMTGMYPARIHT
jgi:arylsulfatase A-like enzyme